jgi:hypothetical protein
MVEGLESQLVHEKGQVVNAHIFSGFSTPENFPSRRYREALS